MLDLPTLNRDHAWTKFQNENQAKEGGKGSLPSSFSPRRPYFLLFSQETTTLEIRFRSGEQQRGERWAGALQQIGLDFQRGWDGVKGIF